MYADAHGHWSDKRVSDELRNQWFQECSQNNIVYFLEAGVDPKGWVRQKKLVEQYPQNFKNSFGLHPYFVAQSSSDECEQALDALVLLLPQSSALGETGLDFRAQYAEEQATLRQIEFFENQIQLAKAYKKPLVLHIVKAHNEALKILNLWDAGEVGGMVHSFNSSIDVAESYLDLNFFISVGGAVTYPKNAKLREAISKIPLERLLIESDCPDQSPQGWQKEINSPLSVLNVAQSVAEIKNIEILEVLEKTTSNFKSLFR
ncbi:MAG: TatD family hydrolase [Pseudobdellovibrio sp.]